MAKQTVTLQPGESQVVTFEATPREAKTYHVSVDGLSGSFEALPVEMNYIYGTVYDHRTWNTLAGVRVEANGWVGYTDGSGNYHIDIPDGNYTLSFSKKGYKPEVMKITVYGTPGMFEMALYPV